MYKYDYKKLVRVTKYFQENTKVAMKLEAENTHVVRW